MFDLQEYLDCFDIKKGDVVHISSDVRMLLCKMRSIDFEKDINRIIDSLQERVGEEGTLIFPTYNWDFCHDVPFDYKTTPSQVGALGNTALKRKDFKRTYHPIYSYAVWGKGAPELLALRNKDSFVGGTPFEYMREHNAKNIAIAVEYSAFTYVHYVEQVCKASYRFLKRFRADYIDEDGNREKRTYTMYVRYIRSDVKGNTAPLGKLMEEKGVAIHKHYQGLSAVTIDMAALYPYIEKDILENRSRNICSYKGQND